MTVADKVFEQMVANLTQREDNLKTLEDDQTVWNTVASEEDYWVASDCMPIEDEEWANSMY